MRIAVKKLRYGVEFFEDLFEHAKAHKRYGRALKELQNCLGKLNDIEVHSRRGHRVANPRKKGRQQSQKAYAMGFLTGQEQGKRRELVAQAMREGRKIAAAESLLAEIAHHFRCDAFMTLFLISQLSVGSAFEHFAATGSTDCAASKLDRSRTILIHFFKQTSSKRNTRSVFCLRGILATFRHLSVVQHEPRRRLCVDYDRLR